MMTNFIFQKSLIFAWIKSIGMNLFVADTLKVSWQDIHFQGHELRELPAPVGYHWSLYIYIYINFILDMDTIKPRNIAAA